jgi:hypothetical protein
MGMQPIDLQTLLTQVDKVAKNQSLQKEGLQIHQALQQIESQKKAEEQVQSVNEAPEMGEETGKIKDQEKRQSNSGGHRQKEKEAEEDAPVENIFRDPALGRNIDISG